jgi:hypothetical protein
VALAPVLLASEAVNAATSWLAQVPAGRYEAFAAVLRGTANAAQTFTPGVAASTGSDVGRIRLTEAGRDLVNVDAFLLHQILALKGGALRVQATTAGASQYSFMLPRGFYDDNCHQVIAGDNVQLSITFGANWPTVFGGAGSATWRLYGLVRQTGEMVYNHRIIQQTVTASAAGTFTLKINDENLLAVYIANDTAPASITNIDTIRITVDGEVMVNVTAAEDLADISDMLNNTDSIVAVATANPNDGTTTSAPGTGNNRVFEVQVANPGEVGEFLTDESYIETSVAAAIGGNLNFVLYTADFSPNKLRQTQEDTKAIFARKLNRKQTLGRTRPIQAMRMTGEA